MTIIATEIQKWKRNKIVWCILALTLLSREGLNPRRVFIISADGRYSEVSL